MPSDIYPPSANEIQAAMLPREKSGEQMHVGANKYGNVQNVIEQGRIESQRMLIDRYQRGVNN